MSPLFYSLLFFLIDLLLLFVYSNVFGGQVSTFKEACLSTSKKYLSSTASASKANRCLVGIELVLRGFYKVPEPLPFLTVSFDRKRERKRRRLQRVRVKAPEVFLFFAVLLTISFTMTTFFVFLRFTREFPLFLWVSLSLFGLVSLFFSLGFRFLPFLFVSLWVQWVFPFFFCYILGFASYPVKVGEGSRRDFDYFWEKIELFRRCFGVRATVSGYRSFFSGETS